MQDNPYSRGVKTSYGQSKKYCYQNSNNLLIDMHKNKGIQWISCLPENWGILSMQVKYLTQGRGTIVSAQ